MKDSLSRIEELQADRALWGLEPTEQQEFEHALRATGLDPDPSYEHAAAAATAALLDGDPSGPRPELLERLRRRAAAELPRADGVGRPGLGWLSHFVGAAAAMLALILWLDRPAGSVPVEAQRASLLTTASPATWTWTKGKSPLSGDPAGDVVWDAESQRGFMRFRNLPVNDPGRRQYQLWIIDANRTPEHPVDGGVFDIPTGATEVVIPIDPKLPVFQAAAFVVTVENPGGVVVSDREHIVALAQPQ